MLDQETHRTLSPQKLKQWMDENRSFSLIDTLLDDHYQKAHLPGALNACVFQVIFMDQIQQLIPERSTAVVVYGSSNHSMDAVCAAQKLDDNGYANVHVLEGGISAWRDAGLPLEGEATAAPDDPETILTLQNRAYKVDREQSTFGKKHYSHYR